MPKRATKNAEAISRMKTMYTDIGTCKLLALKLMPKATSDPSVLKTLSSPHCMLMNDPLVRSVE